jgi:5-amino-6-(5-phosphoribosylamino)uracil reductase
VTRLVYVPEPAGQRARDRLGTAATVIAAGERGDLRALLADLRARGVRRLLVEGGNSVFTQFLAAGLADELHLAIAPLLVGDPAAPRFAAAERISDLPADRIELAESRQVGDVVLARYLLSGRGGAHGQAAS